MQEKMWAYMIHLSANMWGDPGSASIYSAFETELSTDDAVWKQVMDFLPSQGFNTVLIDVGDGIEYESHPEISIKGAWSKEKMKRQLDYMRSLGLTPIPKLNFSTSHDAWLKEYSRMVSTSKYYQVCEDLIREVAELFGHPKYFHLGLDEENVGAPTILSYCCYRMRDLWWHDAYFFFDVCEKVGTRPWIWADACKSDPETYIKKMPKSVLQSNWAYQPIKKNADGTYQSKAYQTYCTLEEAGFDQIPTSSTWDCWYNSLETMQLSRKHIAPERLAGHMTAPWIGTKPFAIYALLHDALQFGNAKKEVYPEY